MGDLTYVIFYTLCAGACIPLGGLVAYIEKIKPEWLENEFRHSVIAFGGGILLAAVTFILVPEGSEYVDQPVLSVVFVLLGGLCLFAVERFLGLKRRDKPQFTAMLLDYVPESLALGGAFAIGAQSAPLLAILVGLQNLPEGFNAYRELHSLPNARGKSILIYMFFLVPIGPLVAVLGWVNFSDNVMLLGAVMLFAAGGILYLIFQDIAPQSRMQRHWAPPLGAVLGFCLGMLGQSLMVAV
jgi:ZIP family zinc transporter